MSEEDIQLLAEKLAGDGGMTPDQMLPKAQEIASYDSDIWAAAMDWAKTEKMPDGPIIEGRNPAGLNTQYYAVQVFDLLDGFRHCKERTRETLKHFPGREQIGPDKRELSRKERTLRSLQGFLSAMYRESVQDYDEAVATGLTTPLVGHLRQHRDQMRKLCDEMHDALLTDWDLQHGAVPRKG
jgi:hypothetical protein